MTFKSIPNRSMLYPRVASANEKRAAKNLNRHMACNDFEEAFQNAAAIRAGLESNLSAALMLENMAYVVRRYQKAAYLATYRAIEKGQ